MPDAVDEGGCPPRMAAISAATRGTWMVSVADRTGTSHVIDFTNLAGLADGSFASASDPGTGICEVCHTTTRYYRSDGTGSAHFVNTCTVCHTHAQAFAPF